VRNFEELTNLYAIARDFGMQEQRPAGDGFVTGFAASMAAGLCVRAGFTVFGGSLSKTNALKICKLHGPGDARRRSGYRLNDSAARASRRASLRSPLRRYFLRIRWQWRHSASQRPHGRGGRRGLSPATPISYS